jgi:hypothetical protein
MDVVQAMMLKIVVAVQDQVILNQKKNKQKKNQVH